ncbi:MAG: hypothetical protein KKF44_01705 [Nanoarchaeota archaeon]|nr:hypothetical protein [Nanoarchaeota archaeon]
MKRKIKKKKTTFNFKKDLSKINIRIVFLLFLGLVFFFRYKRMFFLIFFIAIDLLLTYLKTQWEFFNPIKITDFAVFMCTFAYDTSAGIILAVVHLVTMPFSGKFTHFKILVSLTLFLQVFIIDYLRFLPVVTAGKIVLVFRLVSLYVINLLLFRDFGSLHKNISMVSDFVFWFIFYSLLGNFFYGLMAV